jgi:hypothetical protein
VSLLDCNVELVHRAGSDITFAVVIDDDRFTSTKRREHIKDQSIPIHPPELLAGVQLRAPPSQGLLHSSLSGGLAQYGLFRAHSVNLERPALSTTEDFEQIGTRVTMYATSSRACSANDLRERWEAC